MPCRREASGASAALGVDQNIAANMNKTELTMAAGAMFLAFICGGRADDPYDQPAEGLEISPYIEATEITPKGEFSDIRTLRTYKAGRGDTLLASSTTVIVPWFWGEKEVMAFCKPTFEVAEGELVETTKDWWEEAARTNYPCVVLGSKVMVNRKISRVRAGRGIITTVGTRRQPVRSGSTIVIPEEGQGERFVAVILGEGEGADLACGEHTDSGEAQTEDGNTERRWKAAPGKEISIQIYQTP